MNNYKNHYNYTVITMRQTTSKASNTMEAENG